MSFLLPSCLPLLLLLLRNRYGSLQDVDETLKKLRSSAPSEAMLVEEVGPEEIAGVVSKWTGAR
jgi:hypothetical protein